MDKEGIPIHYKLFPGNRLDKQTFRSIIGEVRKNYGTGRVIVVADMGIITGDNIFYLTGNKPEKPQNGYVFSFSVRGGSKAFQDYILDELGYTDSSGNKLKDDADFKIKSRVTYRDINVTMSNGKTEKKTVYEKQVVFWSRKYFQKARAERAEVLAKAESLIAAPKKFNKATSYGAAAYINNLEYDKQTGEILETGKSLNLNIKKIEDEEHINVHFLTCFIALTILRLIQKKTNKEYSSEKIIECLNKIECMHEYENIYLFNYRDKISDALGAAFGIDFTKKRLQLAEIKKILGDVKK